MVVTLFSRLTFGAIQPTLIILCPSSYARKASFSYPCGIRLSFIEFYQNCSHIISTFSIRCGFSEDVIKHPFHRVRHILSLLIHISFKFVDAPLVIQTVPYSIAGQNDELVIIISITASDIWKCRNCLFIGC